MLQKVSSMALAALMMATMVPQINVMAAETSNVSVQAEAAADPSAADADAASQNTADASAAVTDENFADVCSSNYSLYTESKTAGTEEVAREEAEKKAAEEAAAKAAAEAAQKAAAAKAAAQKAAATATSYTSTGSYSGRKLTRSAGTVMGPSGKEVYYNMNMSVVVSVLKRRGYSGNYWVRSDGVKMFGNYVMVAANYRVHPYGSIVPTTLGSAIVCDTGTFASSYPNCLDVAVSW